MFVPEQGNEDDAADDVANRRKQEKSTVVGGRDSRTDEQPHEDLDSARDTVGKVGKANRGGDEPDEKDPSGGVLCGGDEPREQAHEPPGEDCTREHDPRALGGVRSRELCERRRVHEMWRDERDDEAREHRGPDDVPEKDQSPEPTEISETTLAVEHRKHRQCRVFGEQFRPTEHDEDEPN